ncbi:protein translocase subunit SecD [Sphingomonas canadensis]|uniref:Protein translocase subunit SecD n=1 Tax=Sphingomonas canadensis TaxID=1219257 RepID=A0ABW3HA90_9SPHN|nr:protein translocase subunit SecD [Sphingomonas canadensis]MCW3835914.1 protein translocase subunit SecD [Sphingomonas canadensis]
MLEFPRWKVWAVIVTIVVTTLLAVPSFLPASALSGLPGWMRPTISLGLDLAGGSYLLLEADTKDVAAAKLDQMRENVRNETRREKIQISPISTENGKLRFMVADASKVDLVRERLNPYTTGAGMSGQRTWNIEVVNSQEFVLTPTKQGLNEAIDTAMGDAREVVERRINAMGTREPTIVRQGTNRIVVQVPGLQDPEGLKRQLGQTAKLEFKLVNTAASDKELESGLVAPTANGERSEVLSYPGDPAGRGKIAVFSNALITGDMVVNAIQDYDQQNGRPIVTLTLDGAGSKRFAKVTTENVNRPFAIIVDGVVISAPNIQEPIIGGQARISGGFTVESANELAISLRSGKLPVALKVVQESTVSPELGRDSIEKGVLAGVLGTAALIFFMLITYMRFGVYTTLALLVNAVMIIGIMAVFNATLTLPGIAGFVLTIGAAVDANVLINERIREEQRIRNRNALSSVEFGYKEASRAIFDANITNVISAVIMFAFGSGPIRGFAIVLAIGIVTSVFTGVTFTRLLVADWLKRNRPKSINI